MINAATLCVADIKSVLQSIAKIKGKIVQIYSEDELLDKTKVLTYPACGVIYEGMRSVGDDVRAGMSCELVLSVILINSLSNLSSLVNTAANDAVVLDTIRNGMIGRKSPAGHKWKFVVEAAAKPNAGTVMWVQRWATPIILIPS